MITKRDVAMIAETAYVRYKAREMGTVDVDRIICQFEEGGISAGITVLFKKGNPLLERSNILMRRYLEAGLQERIWGELKHRASLQGGGTIGDPAGDVYFQFSVSHLKPAVVLLLVGTVLSSVVFIGELTVNCLCKRRGRIEFLL
jgi:hypothetical protein